MEELDFDIRKVSDQDGGASDCFFYFFGIDKMEEFYKEAGKKKGK